jgi:hypothetical protein
MLPFELERPLLPLGPLVLTNVEVLLAAVLALALVAGPVTGGPRLPRLWLALALWFIGAALLAAALTPESRTNALKATLRTTEGLLLVVATLRLAPTMRHGRAVATALSLGATAAVLLGLAEHIAGYDFPWLAVVRPMPTYAGPFLRLAGPFDYANQAAIYFEATLPLTFALTLDAARAGRHARATAGGVAVLLQVQATLFTFSRAGFVTLLLVCAGTAAWLLLARNRRSGRVWAGLTALVAVVVVANWLISPSFRLRLASDVDGEWYRATVVAPAELTLAAAETRPIEITLTNRRRAHLAGGRQPTLRAGGALADGRRRRAVPAAAMGAARPGGPQSVGHALGAPARARPRRHVSADLGHASRGRQLVRRSW